MTAMTGLPAAEATCDPAPIRVLLVDDQALVRAGFRIILESEPGIVVVGEAVDGAAAYAGPYRVTAPPIVRAENFSNKVEKLA